MIQSTGLTKIYRRGRPPALLDLTFDARPGVVTALLGPENSGKSTALRLMLQLERGLGVALFDGRTYRRLRRPEREVGVVLHTPRSMGGHPGRKARGHLRMLAAAVGVPAGRADELLEQTRLATVADHRLRSFSPGMSRRLALAAALLGTPGTLLLDAPTEGLSPRNVEWFHSFLRSFAVAGGTVLVTTRTPQEAAQLADRVLTLDQGRLVTDQPVAEFRRTRLRPEVAVRGPQMARLADLLIGQGAQVRRDGGAGLAVVGIGRTEIGELAYRNGILLHELSDRAVEQPAPRATLPSSSGRSGHVQVKRATIVGQSPGPAPAPASATAAAPAAPAPTPDRALRSGVAASASAAPAAPATPAVSGREGAAALPAKRAHAPGLPRAGELSGGGAHTGRSAARRPSAGLSAALSAVRAALVDPPGDDHDPAEQPEEHRPAAGSRHTAGAHRTPDAPPAAGRSQRPEPLPLFRDEPTIVLNPVPRPVTGPDHRSE
ncbi:ATP-binding cassette domain-containing protein [Kitasatospora sp. NPDC050543]|uniref:ATP-binding cassette domain-containing protein n=1 Tax=Kitasatospora sp. NPDC050543 TaxID=3364054 RepID=UPI0037A8C087